MAPDTSNNSYLLEIDGANCYVVGGKSISANAWTWVDYQNGNTASKVNLSLTKGTHSVKFIGRQPNVKLDRLVATSDLTCMPTGNGDNCNTPSDTTPPSVDITDPKEGTIVSGTVAITANASDNIGVSRVEFFVDSQLITTDTSAPYSASWDSKSSSNGSHRLTAKAFDAAGNQSTDSYLVTVRDGDSQPPAPPSNVVATPTHNSVTVGWGAVSGAVGYTVSRDGVPMANVGNTTTFTDTSVLPNTQYIYHVTAFDAAGNKSLPSEKVTVKTLDVPDTEAPSAPTNLTATAANSTQVNLSWNASTDNVGVAEYEVYRKTANKTAEKVASVASTSFGDTNLKKSTAYTYYVIAKDPKGNTSGRSPEVTVKTPAAQRKGVLRGTVLSGKTNKPTAYAKVRVVVGNNELTSVTNSQGRYQIRKLDPGRYNVTYSKGSTYFPRSLSVRVNNNVVTQDVTLKYRQ